MPSNVDERKPGQEPSALIDHVADWLIEQALGETALEALFEGCCERLLGAGIPLSRGHVTFRVLHPLYRAMGLTWRPGRGVSTESFVHHEDDATEEAFAKSPFWHMMQTQTPFLRRHLTGDEAVLDFPVLREFRDSGATDYLGYLVDFGGSGASDGVAGSWITDRTSGFSNRDVRSLLRIQQRMGVACKMRIREQIASNVVNAYLGKGAGRRVLDGQIQRGDGQSIRAVIWYSDLRGSTHMADILPRDAYIRTLNQYFECAGGAVLAHGGEILAFIGDAILAIFPVDEEKNSKAACEAALAACGEARRRLAALNRERQAEEAEALSFGLALHLGDVLFGNIGLPERVSFSVIGPTVNEVARLEALTKELDREILASGTFASQTSIAWESLGCHELRGVTAPVEVFSPSPS